MLFYKYNLVERQLFLQNQIPCTRPTIIKALLQILQSHLNFAKLQVLPWSFFMSNVFKWGILAHPPEIGGLAIPHSIHQHYCR